MSRLNPRLLGSALVGALLLGTGVLLTRASAPSSEVPSAAESFAPPARTVQPSSDSMRAAAQAFLATLDDEQRERLQLPFDDAARQDWHYIPRDRPGLSLGSLTEEQREAAFRLLRSALSAQGYRKATGIIELEAILGELTNSPDYRDPDRYTFTLFGSPDADAPWGWRLEGHHLSLNFSAVTQELVAATPHFVGTNPATVPEGHPRAGWRVLHAEEDRGLSLMRMLDADQRAQALFQDQAPTDVVTGADRRVDLAERQGLPAAAMTPTQRDTLLALVRTYVDNVKSAWAAAYMDSVRQAGVDEIHFAWAGADRLDAPHYYRIHGPTFLIEFMNAREDVNHVHAVWRDLDNDFGVDWLRRHYEQHPPGSAHGH